MDQVHAVLGDGIANLPTHTAINARLPIKPQHGESLVGELLEAKRVDVHGTERVEQFDRRSASLLEDLL